VTVLQAPDGSFTWRAHRQEPADSRVDERNDDVTTAAGLWPACSTGLLSWYQVVATFASLEGLDLKKKLTRSS
jgi:hypothetical protein